MGDFKKERNIIFIFPNAELSHYTIFQIRYLKVTIGCPGLDNDVGVLHFEGKIAAQ